MPIPAPHVGDIARAMSINCNHLAFGMKARGGIGQIQRLIEETAVEARPVAAQPAVLS
jgi:hypothetical protein